MNFETAHFIISVVSAITTFFMLISSFAIVMIVAESNKFPYRENREENRDNKLLVGLMWCSAIVTLVLVVVQVILSVATLMTTRNLPLKIIMNVPKDIAWLVVAITTTVVMGGYVKRHFWVQTERSSTKSLNKVKNPARWELDFWLDIFLNNN